MSEEQKFESVEETVEVAELDEATTAAASLKPNGGRTTKSELLSQMMKAVAGMKKEDLSAFLEKTLAQVGKEDESVPANASKNQASIAQGGSSAPSPSNGTVKEDITDIFSGEELSEDFRNRASTLFEAAVNNRVAIEEARLQEEYEQKLEEQVTSSIDELHEQVNKYMEYVVDKWMSENELAIATAYRVEATEKFLDGLKGLFVEHYVEVPEEKVDLLAGMEEKIAELEEALERSEAEKVQLTNDINEAIKEATFEDVSEGLTDTQVEKLRTLSEGVEFSSQEEYSEKLTIIKDQYFSEAKEAPKSGLITEEESIGSNDVEEEAMVVPQEMQSYFQAISKTIRK